MFKHWMQTGEKPELNEQRGFIGDDEQSNQDVWREAGYRNGVAFI
jgi:hypothetical protein